MSACGATVGSAAGRRYGTEAEAGWGGAASEEEEKGGLLYFYEGYFLRGGVLLFLQGRSLFSLKTLKIPDLFSFFSFFFLSRF